MALPDKVTIVEVSPRDGLQNESQTIPLQAKLRLIDDLGAAGQTVIEAGNRISATLGRPSASRVARALTGN